MLVCCKAQPGECSPGVAPALDAPRNAMYSLNPHARGWNGVRFDGRRLQVSRAELLDQLAEYITARPFAHPTRVALDGVDASGKTTLANELAPLIEAHGQAVIRASVDGFHRPRAERYRRGADSPEGYYEDSFDYTALRDSLVLPLGPGGTRMYRTRVFDFRADAPLDEPPRVAPANAILLFDGVFLLRPELRDLWDVRVFVAADFAVTLRRAQVRDVSLFGDADAIRTRYIQRYIPGQQLYLSQAHPQAHADVIVENDDPQNPSIVWRTL